VGFYVWYSPPITGQCTNFVLFDVSSVGVRVSKQRSHFPDHPGSGSHCKAGPFCEIQATGPLPRSDLSIMMTYYYYYCYCYCYYCYYYYYYYYYYCY